MTSLLLFSFAAMVFRARRFSAGLACVWLAATLAGCGRPSPPPSDALSCGDCNLVLISIDTLRADHLGCYGYARETSPRIDALAGQGVYRTWSATNSDLLTTGAVGSENTIDLSLGGEFLSDIRRPNRRPIRFGGHYATLPFLLELGQQPTEVGVSAGSGMTFAQDRGGIDLALEYLWRSAGEFKERVFQLSIGVSVRP